MLLTSSQISAYNLVYSTRSKLPLAESGPFVCRCLISLTMPRFHTPLIEPDRRSYASGSRRKDHVFAHGKLAVRVVSRTKPNF